MDQAFDGVGHGTMRKRRSACLAVGTGHVEGDCRGIGFGMGANGYVVQVHAVDFSVVRVEPQCARARPVQCGFECYVADHHGHPCVGNDVAQSRGRIGAVQEQGGTAGVRNGEKTGDTVDTGVDA
jgi:hypothetical protein